MQARPKMKRMKRLLRCREGFSLVEVLVTCVIFSFLAAAINATIVIGNSSWAVNSVEVELQQDLRQAMERIRNDLQQTGAVSLDASVLITTTEPDSGTYHSSPDCYLLTSPSPACDPAYDWTTYSTFNFQTVAGTASRLISWDSNSTQFDLSGTDLTRTYGAGSAVAVAENIQSVQMRRLYNSTKIVEVRLTAQKNTLTGAQGRTISSTVNFQIQLRN